MLAAYYPHVSSQKDNFQRAYSGDQEQNSDSELSSHFRNSTNYMNQTSDAGPYAEILPGTSLQHETCHEILPDRAWNEMVFVPRTSDTIHLQHIQEQLNTEAGNPVGNSLMTTRTQVDILDCEPNFQLHGLALSLGTQMQSAIPSLQYQYTNMVFPLSSSDQGPVLEKWTLSCEGAENNPSKGSRNSEFLSGFGGGNHRSVKGEVLHNPQCLLSHSGMSHMNLHESTGYPNNIVGSKYLKPIQQLLDEFVNVKRPVKRPESSKGLDDLKESDARVNNLSNLPTSISTSSEPSNLVNSSSELSPGERQDLQEKKKKLLLMLDEVDGRFKHYFSQMQILVSSFDTLAGHGAAKSYTGLSLQTISSYFRCLRDAISGQMEVTRRRLGEQDTSNSGQKGIPRLRYVDHHLRQQRAIQQLGVMWHAWRPQRGLPECSDSVLRAWLFEHFLHPYPNDSEKIILARQTGLTRGQEHSD